MTFLFSVSKETQDAVTKTGDVGRGQTKKESLTNTKDEDFHSESTEKNVVFDSRTSNSSTPVHKRRQSLTQRLTKQRELENEHNNIFFSPAKHSHVHDVAALATQNLLVRKSHADLRNTTHPMETPHRPCLIWVKGPFELEMFVLDHRSDIMVRWMVIIFLFTTYTAVLTPVEVSFMTTKLDGWFFINRVVDFFFLCDLFVNFILTYQCEGHIERHPKIIALKYLQFWFWLDLISLIPYDALAFAMSGTGDSALSDVKLLRIIRLFRLIKLARILRAGRMFQSYQMEYAINYNQIALIKFLITIVFLIHLMTCGLVFLPTIQGSDGWLEAMDLLDAGGWEIYIVAMYWSSMTVSTIGYGDVSLVTHIEQIYASICMMIGATAYAFIVGQLCGLIVNLDKEGNEFTNELSDLNIFMNKHEIPPESQKKIRQFYGYSKEARALRNKEHLLQNLSPALYNLILIHTNKAWIQNVPFLNTKDPEILAMVSNALKTASFAPNEIIVRDYDHQLKLIMVTKGVIFYRGRIYTKNRYFGEGVVLVRVPTYGSPAITNKYADISYLERVELNKILHKYPEIRYQAKKMAIKLRLKDVGTCVLIKSMALKYKKQDSFQEAQARLYSQQREPCKTIEDLEKLVLDVQAHVTTQIQNLSNLMDKRLGNKHDY